MADDNSTAEGDESSGSSESGDDLAALPEWARAQLTKANAEAAKYRTRVRELEPKARKAEELENAGRSAEERLAAERAEAASRASTAELRALRLDVALDFDLTGEDARVFARRLVGETEEELRADAVELLKLMRPKADETETERRRPPGRTPAPLKSGGGHDPAGLNEDELTKAVNQMLGIK